MRSGARDGPATSAGLSAGGPAASSSGDLGDITVRGNPWRRGQRASRPRVSPSGRKISMSASGAHQRDAPMEKQTACVCSHPF